MDFIKVALYSVAILTSLGCTVLLARGYRERKYSLLLWSAICFGFLTLNNVLLFVDMLLVPDMDLRLWRLVAALTGVLSMLYAFVWDSE